MGGTPKEHDEPPDPRLVEEETLTIVRPRGEMSETAPSHPEPPTRRMVRDAALEAEVGGQLDPVASWEDDWDDDIPEDIPELAGTAKMPAHVECRALPFRKRDGGGRPKDLSREDPFTGLPAPATAPWARADGPLDASQLPSALAPSDAPPAGPVRRDREGKGTLGAMVVFGLFVLLVLVLLALAIFGV